jgi:hypothetical protein
MKDRSGASVAEKLRGHCLKLRSTAEGMQLYSHRIHLQSDQGSEFINRDVLNWSKEVGAIQSVVQEISASGRIQHANGKLKILGQSLDP